MMKSIRLKEDVEEIKKLEDELQPLVEKQECECLG